MFSRCILPYKEVETVGKFFDDTMQGLREACAIHNILKKKGVFHLKYTKKDIIKRYKEGETLDFLFFWSPKGYEGIYSQWWKSPFNVDGITYSTAEQFMMAEKARAFGGNDDILEKILSEKDPKECRNLGRKVRNYDDAVWSVLRKDAVVRGNVAKFSQCNILRERLAQDGNKILVEASPYDTIWGIGLRADTQGIENPENWPGENNLGFAIMEARDIILGNVTPLER